MKLESGGTIDIEQRTELSRDRDVTRRLVPLPEMVIDVREAGRGKHEQEGWAILLATPIEARQLAAELTRLADEIEGR